MSEVDSNKLYMMIVGGTIFPAADPREVPNVRRLRASEVVRTFRDLHGAVFERPAIEVDGSLSGRRHKFIMHGTIVVGNIDQIVAFNRERISAACRRYDEGEPFIIHGGIQGADEFQGTLRRRVEPGGKATVIPFCD